MKEYIASYIDKKDNCWDLSINADNYKDALKEARRAQKEMGRLYSVRLRRS